MSNISYKFIVISLYSIFSVMILLSCSSTDQTIIKQDTPEQSQVQDDIFKRPDEYNFVFNYVRSNDSSSETESKLFFRLFVDNTEIGRTETGKEGESVSYKGVLDTGKDLELRIEMYILDSNKGKYVKVKKINHPKPDRMVISIPEDRILIVNFSIKGPHGNSDFATDFEQ